MSCKWAESLPSPIGQYSRQGRQAGLLRVSRPRNFLPEGLSRPRSRPPPKPRAWASSTGPILGLRRLGLASPANHRLAGEISRRTIVGSRDQVNRSPGDDSFQRAPRLKLMLNKPRILSGREFGRTDLAAIFALCALKVRRSIFDLSLIPTCLVRGDLSSMRRP